MFALVSSHPLGKASDLEQYIRRGSSAQWSSDLRRLRFSDQLAEPIAAWPTARLLAHAVLSLPPAASLPESVWGEMVTDLHAHLHRPAVALLPWYATSHQWTQCEHMHYLGMLDPKRSGCLLRDFREAVGILERKWKPWLPPTMPSKPDRQRRHRRIRRYERQPFEIGREAHDRAERLGWNIRVLGEYHDEIRILSAGDWTALLGAALRGYRLELVVPEEVGIVGLRRRQERHPVLGEPAWSAILEGEPFDWHCTASASANSLSRHDVRAAMRREVTRYTTSRGVAPDTLVYRQALPLAGPGWELAPTRSRKAVPIIVEIGDAWAERGRPSRAPIVERETALQAPIQAIVR